MRLRRLLAILGSGLLVLACQKDRIQEDPGVAVRRPAVQTGLPVMTLDTRGLAPIVSKEEYLPAMTFIQDGDGALLLQPVSCEVRGRGNTTWYWPKKPYLLKLDEKISVLGMPAHKRWILLANFMDRTLMRNLVAYHVSSLTLLAWTPRCVPVELMLNGQHVGNYLLIEQVRVDKNRVNVNSKEGFLLELDFHYDNEVQWMDPHGSCVQMTGGIPFGIKHPDTEDLSPERTQAIRDQVSQAASVLYGPDFKDPDRGYARYLDVDSFIDYWLVFEVMGNHELGNPGSVYMHCDKGGRITAGPCWDFDWGILSYKSSPQARTDLIGRHAIWYDRLFQDPAFADRVRARYRQLRPALETVPAYMEEMEELLARSAELNFRMWNPAEDASMNGGVIVNGDEWMEFHEACRLLREIYLERLAVIDKNL